MNFYAVVDGSTRVGAHVLDTAIFGIGFRVVGRIAADRGGKVVS
jgi:hypothetical protein